MSPSEALKTNTKVWLTIGAFDGVHRGHQAVIGSLVKGAHASGCSAVVVTFSPHPAEVLKDITAPYYLTTPEEREDLIKSLGVDEVLTLPFTHEFARKTAREFIADLYQLRPFACILVGHDFTFGVGQEGNIPLLKRFGQEFGFEIRTIPPFLLNGQVVSSSNIRHLVLKHQMKAAAQMLGRWYSVSGEVVHGDGRGKHIGIPTANVAAWHKRLMPPSGVYAARVELGHRTLPAVLNIGSRPTFYFPPAGQTVEVHIFDFHEDIYKKTIRVNFIEYLRSEKRFQSAVELTAQIQTDIQRTREVLAHAPQTPDLPA
jgi:riboflavin kinase/FMN adenylyltransferase